MNHNQIHKDSEIDEQFSLEFGEQTRIELSEAEVEFLKVLDDELEQKEQAKAQ